MMKKRLASAFVLSLIFSLLFSLTVCGEADSGPVETVTFEGYDNYTFRGIRLNELAVENLVSLPVRASVYEEKCENPSIDSEIEIGIMASTGLGMTLTGNQGTTYADYFLVKNPTDQRVWLQFYVFSVATGEKVRFTTIRLDPGETGILEDKFVEGQILGHEDEYEIKYYTQLLDPREEVSSTATAHRVYMPEEDPQAVKVILDSLVDYDVYGRFEIFFFKDGVIVNSHRLNSDFGITPVQENGSGFITWNLDMGVDFDSYFIQLDMGTDSSVTNYGF